MVFSLSPISILTPEIPTTTSWPETCCVTETSSQSPQTSGSPSYCFSALPERTVRLRGVTVSSPK